MTIKVLAAMSFVLPAIAFADVSYTVRQGDTLLNIADRQLKNRDRKDPRRYKLAQRIRAMNPQIKDANALEPGDVISLPDTPASTASAKPRPSKPVPADNPPPPLAPKPPTAVAVEEISPEPPPPLPPAPAPAPPPAEPVAAHAPVPPPPPAEEPAPQEAHGEVAHEGGHHDFIALQPRYQLLKLDAKNLTTEVKGKLTATSSVGMDLQYGHVLSDKAHLLAQAGFTMTNFKDIESEDEATVVTIDHKSEVSKTFAVGGAYDILPSLHFDLMAGMADRTFVVPGVDYTFLLKSLLLPYAELNLSWDFVRTDAFTVGASAIGEYVAGATKDDVEYKSSLEPLYALYWKSNNGHDAVNYRVGLTFKNGHQKTSVSEQHETATLLGAMFMVPL